MCDFKQGDRVQRKSGGEVFTVDYVKRGREVWFTKGTWLDARELRLAYPNPPHKHAELIKAWADGAEIECKSNCGWVVESRPKWYNNCSYRIKPQKSEKEIKIEELEKQARDLADQIAKLKES